jgi:hypothetical protein
VVAIVALALGATPAFAEQPSVGDLFDAPPTTEDDAFKWEFRGWRYAGRGEAIGLGRYVLFAKDRAFIIAATEVITPSSGVGHDGVQKIVAVKRVTPVAGETQAQTCDFVTLTPALAFYAGNIARGFFVVGSEIIERRWFTAEDCYDEAE